MKPSNYLRHPYDSILQKTESEIVARNIMVILSRTGNKFRCLSWEEYDSERQKDGGPNWSEKLHFEKVANYCASSKAANRFCKDWASA